MKVEAKVTRVWRDRMFIVFIFFAGSAAWFFWDGFYAYPKQQEAASAYESFKISAGTEEISEEQWADYAMEHGFDTDIPGEAKTDGEIMAQVYIGIAFVFISLGYLVWFIRECVRVIYADDDCFWAADGRKVAYESVVGLDMRKWKNKGIAYAVYEENGKTKRVILDDYKYAGAEIIVKECERHILAKKEAKKIG